ncbi:MAG: hypothetical protein BV458_08715 [Thermoplasmata archaeon M9B2D]|nr:MAG: hypothetical protein BV458_08715 [Thermoplasmata archaeon M9B2D]
MEIDTLKQVSDIIQSVLKSRKNIRMYPENNPIYTKSLESTINLFNDYFEYYDALPMKIKQLEILYDSEPVYYNPEKEDSLSLLFFKDGIRELTFKKGLDVVELEDFFKIIMLDLDSDDSDDDIVTLMWERDFMHISYIVDETFLLEDDQYEDRAIQEAKENLATEDDVLKAYEEAFDAEDTRHIPVVPLSDEDIEHLKNELDRDHNYYVFKIFNLLFEMFMLAGSKEDLQDMVSMFRSAIDYALQYADIEMVIDALKKAEVLISAETTPEHIKPYLRMILAYINSERVIRFVGELLDSRAEFDDKKVNSLFAIMDKTAIPGLIRILGDLSTIHARKAIVNSLIILGKKDLAAVAKGLNDERWFVVRNIIYVFRNIGDKRALDYLVKKMRHNDIRVRKEIIKAFGEFGGQEIVQHLKMHINDPDPATRVLVVKSISRTGAPIARKLLMEQVSSPDFKMRDLAEKKEFFEALSRWQDPQMLDFLSRILKKGALFRRGKVNENRACAAFALGVMMRKEALPVLEKHRNLKIPLIREYVMNAIKRIQQHGATAQGSESGS